MGMKSGSLRIIRFILSLAGSYLQLCRPPYLLIYNINPGYVVRRYTFSITTAFLTHQSLSCPPNNILFNSNLINLQLELDPNLSKNQAHPQPSKTNTYYGDY